MKKILSFILIMTMLVTVCVTAFAVDTMEIEASKTLGLAFTVDTTKGVKIVDVNNILTIGEPIITDASVYVNVTAKPDSVGKLTKIEVRTKDGKVVLDSKLIEVIASPVVPPVVAPVLDKATVEASPVVDEVITVTMNGAEGISAEAYNWLKGKNFEKIIFVGENYKWTLNRGDYTKMNITAPIYFDVKVSKSLWTKDTNGNVVEDFILENKVLKALGNTKLDVFFVTVTDDCNIGNIVAKPELEIVIDTDWFLYANSLNVDAFKFNGEEVSLVAKNVAVKYVSGKLPLNITTGGTYVFVDSSANVVVPSTKPTSKPNVSTGGSTFASAIAVLAVMGAVAAGTKFIVK